MPSSTMRRNSPETSQPRRMLSSHGLVPAAASCCNLFAIFVAPLDPSAHALEARRELSRTLPPARRKLRARTVEIALLEGQAAAPRELGGGAGVDDPADRDTGDSRPGGA